MDNSTLTISKEGEVNILAFKEKLTYAKLESIKNELSSNFSFEQKCKVVVSLSELKILDSAGIGLIVSLYKSTIAVEGSFSIVSSNTSITDILTTVGINRIFKIYATLDEALKEG